MVARVLSFARRNPHPRLLPRRRWRWSSLLALPRRPLRPGNGNAALVRARPICVSCSRENGGSKSLFARPRRWAFRPLARREERRDLSDHERRATMPAAERPASLRVAAKIAAAFVEGLD